MKPFDRVEAYRVDNRLFATYEEMVDHLARSKLTDTYAKGEFVQERAYHLLYKMLNEPKKLYDILKEFYG